MTTTVFLQRLNSVVTDLAREMPAHLRYKNLLVAMQQVFPSDAVALLQLNGNVLIPRATEGLSEDTIGRRFMVNDHPRLAQLLNSQEPIRFSDHSNLPDPYDGLVKSSKPHADIHDCMGAAVCINRQPWGVLTLDALNPESFNNIDPVQLKTFINLTEAAISQEKKFNYNQSHDDTAFEIHKALLYKHKSTDMIGNSQALRQLKNEIEIVAPSLLTVLILGETGVGKELVARQIHRLSARAHQAMVYINCAALPENIAESELFGHVKGAFSGAISDRPGKFEVADKGTLFLDEVGELPLTVQAKLLRAIQNGEIQRVGSDKLIQVDVRIIAATNRNLQLEVDAGTFRPDLYHRLSVYPIEVAPLRQRKNDILPLAGFMLNNSIRGTQIRLCLTEQAKQTLINYAWPGNVRELEHVLSRATLKAIAAQGRDAKLINITNEFLDIAKLTPTQKIPTKKIDVKKTSVKTMNLKQATQDFQKALIHQSLIDNKNNLAATARALGLDRSNFYRLLKRFGIK